MKIKNNKAWLMALAVFIISWFFGFSRYVYAGGNDKFQINNDGTIVAGQFHFNSMAEYVRSDYFREKGKRCGTDWRRMERAGNSSPLASIADCSLTSTIIKNEYYPIATHTIPIVFHVIYKSDGTGNISTERIHDQLTVLNEDYGAKVGTMGANGFNSKIQFSLAGITRTLNDSWHNDEDEYGYKAALGWDQDKYLNVYVNTASGYLGYAYLPQDNVDKVYQGVVLLYEAIGGRNNGYDVYDQGRTLVHEIGHHLGLLHTFEGNGCYDGFNAGDLIADTNSESEDHYGCTQTYTCSTEDPIHNYMNYTDDSCMLEFTDEQANRMICSLVNYRPGTFSTGTDAIAVTIPNGGENWNSGTSHTITWSTGGTVANVHIDYSTDSGGTWISVAANTVNNGAYAWTVPAVTASAHCLVRVSDSSDAATHDVSDSVFSISQSAAETVSTPGRPAGANSGLKTTSYPFTTGGSTSNSGHAIQYKFDWDDGSDSGWLAEGTTQASHSWAANGTYDVRAMARCVTHTTIESLWSETHALIISDSGTMGKYNSPSQQKILPEVIWAAATGGGTWMSEVQVTDISGGSIVSVYYNTSAGRRGPFALWNNGGGALRSMKYNNMLETIDGLDSGVFAYYGTVGAVEFVTQDAVHVLQVMARTLNGSYSKTFPGFSVHDSNTAATSRVMVVPNLTNNPTYRSTVGMFNPTADALTVELRLRNAANTQIGTTITKTLNGYGFTAFSPFTDAGIAYPANSFDNVILQIQPTSGTGKVFCFGASANNVTNDPAAHIAEQNGTAHDNGPSSLQILPEAIWAAATGGGTWMSETQIVDVSGGSAVSVYFDYGSGSRRGPFVLWTGGTAGSKVKYANILGQIGAIDTGFTYYGRVGTVEFQTQDNAHVIQMTARTLNGNYSKTFPGLNLVEAETADTGRIMLIQNYASNSTYRSTCGFFNPTTDAVIVEFTLLNASGTQIGALFSKTFPGYDFQAFSPFSEAGVPYPANSFDNVILRVRPTSGSGQVLCFGASANNASNDPAAHLAVQGQ